ncbi:MAG: DUF1902 domain-containing protein [Treponema sp.]|nr:DUF1902 domain-containing protein [Treponema sp.]
MNEFIVALSFDDEASKWYAQNDEIPILLEDFSLDSLIKRVKQAVPEMIEINNLPKTDIYLAFKMEPQAVLI